MKIQYFKCKNLVELKILDIVAYFLKGCSDCLFEDCENLVEMLVLLLLTN